MSGKMFKQLELRWSKASQLMAHVGVCQIGGNLCGPARSPQPSVRGQKAAEIRRPSVRAA
jgi:hypothetical protein